jgi:hypothetical protein
VDTATGRQRKTPLEVFEVGLYFPLESIAFMTLSMKRDYLISGLSDLVVREGRTDAITLTWAGVILDLGGGGCPMPT